LFRDLILLALAGVVYRFGQRQETSRS